MFFLYNIILQLNTKAWVSVPAVNDSNLVIQLICPVVLHQLTFNSMPLSLVSVAQCVSNEGIEETEEEEEKEEREYTKE